MRKFYLQDNRTYNGNYMMWWAKGRQGYTSNLQNAHVFSADELAEMSLRETDIIWDCDYINSKIRHCIDYQDCNHKEMSETTDDEELEDFINELNELSNFYIKLKSSDGNFKASDKMEELKSIKNNLIQMFKEKDSK